LRRILNFFMTTKKCLYSLKTIDRIRDILYIVDTERGESDGLESSLETTSSDSPHRSERQAKFYRNQVPKRNTAHAMSPHENLLQPAKLDLRVLSVS